MFRSSTHRQVTGLCSSATEPSMVKRETYMYNVNTHHTLFIHVHALHIVVVKWMNKVRYRPYVKLLCMIEFLSKNCTPCYVHSQKNHSKIYSSVPSHKHF